MFFDLLRGEGARRADEGLFSLLHDETCLSLDEGDQGPSSVSLRSPASPWRSFTGRQYSSGGGTAAGVFQAAKYVRLKYPT